MAITKARQDELLDELLKGCNGPEEVLGKGGLLKELTKRLVERALEGEMVEHVGYKAHAAEGRGSGNSRNGKTAKTVQSEAGQFEIEVPRDRNGTFEPQFVGKRQKRLSGLSEKVISLYARGLSTREIQGELEEVYGVEVSPGLISNVTDAIGALFPTTNRSSRCCTSRFRTQPKNGPCPSVIERLLSINWLLFSAIAHSLLIQLHRRLNTLKIYGLSCTMIPTTCTHGLIINSRKSLGN